MIKALVTVLLLLYVIDTLCLVHLSLSGHSYLSRATTRRMIKMSIFDNGRKVNDEMLKIENEKLKLREQELEMERLKLNSSVAMKIMEINNAKEMKIMEENNAKEMKIMEINTKNTISIFAIIAFLIFSVQLRDGLLGRITTLTSLLQSFYALGTEVKTLMGKLTAKVVYSAAFISVAVVVVVVSRTGHVLKWLYGRWHTIFSKALRIIRR